MSVDVASQHNVASQHKALIVAGLDLGEGFNRLTGEGTENVCVTDQLSIQEYVEDDKVTYLSFLLRTDEDVTQRLNYYRVNETSNEPYDSTSGPYGSETFRSVLNAERFADPDYDPDNDVNDRVLVIAAQIKTVTRGVALGSEDPLGDGADGLCGEGPARPQSFEEFMAECGTDFLRSETLGGTVFFMTDLSKLSASQAEALERELNVGSLQRRESLPASLNIPGTVEFDVALPTAWRTDPLVAMHIPSAKIHYEDISDLIDEIDDLTSGVVNGANPPVSGAVYGFPLIQDFYYYSADYIEECAQISVPTCYGHVDEFRKALDKYALPQRQLDQLYADVRWKLDNDALVQFPVHKVGSSLVEDKGAHEDFASAYELCFIENKRNPPSNLSLVEAAREACDHAVQTGSYADMCAACVIPAACTPEAFRDRANALPDVALYPPLPPVAGKPETTSVSQGDDPKPNSTTATHICTLGRVQGKFVGGSEGVEVKLNNPGDPNSEWQLNVSSGRSDKSEHIRAQMNCVERVHFIDMSYTTSWLLDYNHSFSITGGTQTVDYLTSNYAIALQGMSGAFEGGGERVQVDWERPGTNPLSNAMQIESQQGYIKGYALEFGVDNPKNGAAQWYQIRDLREDESNSNAYATEVSLSTGSSQLPGVLTRDAITGVTTGHMNLAPLDEAFCFLTSVSGKFDGGTEKAVVASNGGDFWELRVTSGCAEVGDFGCTKPKNVTAHARCYKYDQRN